MFFAKVFKTRCLGVDLESKVLILNWLTKISCKVVNRLTYWLGSKRGRPRGCRGFFALVSILAGGGGESATVGENLFEGQGFIFV